MRAFRQGRPGLGVAPNAPAGRDETPSGRAAMGGKRLSAVRSDIAECEVRLARRPDTADERFLSAVQHLASVLRARGRSEDVLLALSELLEKDYLSPEREQPRR